MFCLAKSHANDNKTNTRFSVTEFTSLYRKVLYNALVISLLRCKDGKEAFFFFQLKSLIYSRFNIPFTSVSECTIWHQLDLKVFICFLKIWVRFPFISSYVLVIFFNKHKNSIQHQVHVLTGRNKKYMAI